MLDGLYFLVQAQFYFEEIFGYHRLLILQPNKMFLLVLIYSLPNAPIHNPYTAKARLNAYGLPMESNLLLSNDDVAFFTMLRDQLNEQLLILQQLSELETQHGYAKRKIIKQNVNPKASPSTLSRL